MLQVDDDRYTFKVEWYEEMAARMREFLFMYYVKSRAIEMYDIKNRRMFLKVNMKENPVELSQLFIGSIINVCGRQLTIKDFADEYTRKCLTTCKEKTLALIKPDAINKFGEIVDRIYQQGFTIANISMTTFSRQEAFAFYEEHKGKDFMTELLAYITSGPIIAMELVGESAISQWREFLGPTDPAVARSQAPNSLRARFGTNKTRNACHGSADAASAARELALMFPGGDRRGQGTPSARFSDCTCCVIKPHALKAGTAGKIISAITEAGFEVSCVAMHTLEKANAEEFYEVYRGVVQEYKGMVSELTSGPIMVLEVRSQDAVKKFREMCGPADPEIARHLRPRTLRALYGVNKIQNAVHCTDLEEDGLLEVEYFFKILPN